MSDEGRARLPVEDPLSTDGKRSSWLARLVPRRIALRALVVDLRAPARMTPGEPTIAFSVQLSNLVGDLEEQGRDMQDDFVRRLVGG